MNYRDYIRSDRWTGKHSQWLQASDHRCSMFPWLRVGKVGSNYHRYAMHHMSYSNLGKEKYWLDVLPLSPIAHDFVIHGILSGFKSAGQQKSYPNAAQRLAHAWCRIHPIGKVLILIAIASVAGGFIR